MTPALCPHGLAATWCNDHACRFANFGTDLMSPQARVALVPATQATPAYWAVILPSGVWPITHG